MAEVAEADGSSSAAINVGADVDSYVGRMELRLRQFKALASRQQFVIEELRSQNAALREERNDLEAARRASSAEIARLCRGAAESAERVAELEAAALTGGAMGTPEEGNGKHVFVDAREPTLQALTQETCDISHTLKPDANVEEGDWDGWHGVNERNFAYCESAGNTAMRAMHSYGSTTQGQTERGVMQHAAAAAYSRSGPCSLTVVVDKENLDAVNGLGILRSQSSRARETRNKGAKNDSTLKQVVRTAGGMGAPLRRGKGAPLRSAQAVYASSRSVAKYAYSILMSTTRR